MEYRWIDQGELPLRDISSVEITSTEDTRFIIVINLLVILCLGQVFEITLARTRRIHLGVQTSFVNHTCLDSSFYGFFLPFNIRHRV